MRRCSIPGCEKPHYGHGWCSKHYTLWRRYGDAHTTRRVERGPLVQRILAHVIITPTCWFWNGGHDGQGYARFTADEIGTFSVQRWMYEHFKGPIPEGYELDHLCHTADATCKGGRTCPHRGCINPDDLEPVTHLTNMSRGHHARKTHCAQGHPFDEDNTIRRVGNKTRRVCRLCMRQYRREYKERIRHGQLVRNVNG